MSKGTLLEVRNALDRTGVGGNHLASALIGLGCFPAEQDHYEQVLTDYGQPCADMWIAWKRIMDQRDPLTKLDALIAAVPDDITEPLETPQQTTLAIVERSNMLAKLLHDAVTEDDR